MISVLLVDDEPGLLELGTIYLEKTGEFSVNSVPSAQSALEMMESTRYDAIVSDFQMPGMDGIQFLKYLRSHNDPTPFIIFTGKGREEVVIEALNAGADFYLQKGGNPKAQFAELANKIQYAVSRMRAEEALRESEKRYRTVIENAGEIIFVAQDGVLKFINRKTFELLQTPPESVIGKPFGDFIHPDDREFVLDRYRRRMEGEDVPSNYECRLVNEAGDMIWAILSAVRISWEGRPATLNFVTDITDRKQAEEALRESEEQYRTVVETTGTALVVIEADTTISFANSEFERMTGFSKGEIEGRKRWTEFVVEEDLARMLRQHQLRRQDGAKALNQYEFRLATREGEIRDIHLTIAVIPGTKKSIASLIDISDRRWMEDALMESEERYRRIFSGMPSAVAIYEACDDGEDFIIRDLNPRAEEIEQIAKDDVIGRRVTEVFPGVEDFGLFSVFQRVWRTGSPEYLPDAIYRDARDPGTWRENWVYRLPGGEIVAIYNDITERKQTENALRESEEKFRTFFETMAPGVFYQRSDGTLVDANPAALEMFGLTREELVGRDSHDPYWEVISESGGILPPEKHPSMIALRTGTPVRDMIVGLHHPPEDDITWVSVDATPLYRDGETDPHQVVATMYNITDLQQADIELFRRQKLIEGMLDGIPDIVGLMLPDYTVVRFNRAGCEALGMTPGEVEGKKCFELIGRDEPCEMCATRQALGTKKTESVEKFVPEIGKYFECSSTPILDENGDVELIIERLHDITGRIREEERSRILAAMVDIAPSSITVHDYEGNFLFANQKTFDIHGYSRSEFLNLKLQELDVPDSAAHIEEHMKRVAEMGEDTFEVRHWRKDGSTIPLEVTIKRVELAGRPALLSIANDITERKQAEESLREREAFLSSIFRAAPTGIGVVRDRILLDANDRLCEITGYTLEEMVEQSVRLLYPTVEEYEFVGRAIYDPAQGSGTGTAETRWKRRDGTIRDILITSTALDPTDPDKGMLFTALDITEQNRAWAAFRQAHRKLTILSGITRHDILNNINVMRGYIDLLESAVPGDEQIRGYIEHINGMSRKIEQQIEFTRVYENLGSEEPEYQDLDAIIDDLDVPDTITIRTSGTDAEIFADPLLKNVFENLLGNSVGHGGDVSHISVTGEVTDGDLVVRWEDDGVGVPAADKERIFEKGFGKIHGLGLFLVREILDLTGISIREAGVEGKGARFEMRVPSGAWRTARTG